MASASSTIRFTGPSNAPIIELETWANADVHHPRAGAKMFTSVDPNRATLDFIPVTVRATGSERNGSRVKVTISVSYQATLTGGFSFTGFWYKPSVSSDERSWTRHPWNPEGWNNTDSAVEEFYTTIGSTFYIKVKSFVDSSQGQVAGQTMRVEIRVPANAATQVITPVPGNRRIVPPVVRIR
jgi:hypothetical protein